MNNAINISSFKVVGRIASIGLMFFLLSILTVGNFFVYGDQTISGLISGNSLYEKEGCDSRNKQPVSTEEEKTTSSKSSSVNTFTEEYLHDHDLFLPLDGSLLTGPVCDAIDTHGLGSDYSSIHCPPPDFLA